MLARTLPSLAHALGAASDLDDAFVRLAEALAESDRDAGLALLRVDPRTALMRERLRVVGGRVERVPLETSVEQLPAAVLRAVQEGGTFAELTEEQGAYARLLRLGEPEPGDVLLFRGLRADRQLVAILAATEPKRVFGTRITERLGPLVALFELALLRFAELDARREAVTTLEAVTQRVHADYAQRLGELEEQLAVHTGEMPAEGPAARLARERDEAKRAEEARRMERRLTVLEQQLTASIGQLEQAHIELHRRSEALRQRTRTLYLLDQVLDLAARTQDATALVDGLLSLVGDDMQAFRCSIFLTAPESGTLYLAAARGLAPHVQLGRTIALGEGIAGRVARDRAPVLVVDVSDASAQPLLGDEYLTSGSFISFPLVLHDTLIGVVNLTNRAQRGLFVEEDVERVRLLGLVIALIASEARLGERLHRSFGAR
ncbi:MAG: GAF domain-containing protein [Gemmatimonadaceae bacterium]